MTIIINIFLILLIIITIYWYHLIPNNFSQMLLDICFSIDIVLFLSNYIRVTILRSSPIWNLIKCLAKCFHSLIHILFQIFNYGSIDKLLDLRYMIPLILLNQYLIKMKPYSSNSSVQLNFWFCGSEDGSIFLYLLLFLIFNKFMNKLRFVLAVALQKRLHLVFGSLNPKTLAPSNHLFELNFCAFIMTMCY